jgi:DNA-binding MarR family transcriptional regulator
MAINLTGLYIGFAVNWFRAASFGECAMSVPLDFSILASFLGSAHIFASVLGEALEQKLWHEASAGQFSVQQLKILKLIGLQGRHLISDVAVFLGISNAAASKAVDKLVQHMLIRRNEGEEDRREIHLTLTGAGKRLLQSYDGLLNGKLAEVLAPYSEEDLSRVIETLNRLSARIIQSQPTPEDLRIQCGIYFTGRCPIHSEMNSECPKYGKAEKAAGD